MIRALMVLVLTTMLMEGSATAALWSHGCVVTNAVCTGAGVPYDCCSGAAAGSCPSSSLLTPATTNVLGPTPQDKVTIRSLERACWWFVNADGGMNSPTFRATGQFKACINDDILAAGNTTVAVNVTRCPDGGRPTTNPLNLCNRLEAIVDNNCGTDAAGDDLIFEPGMYFFDITGNCVAGDTCQMSIEGVDPQRQ